jgi:alpha-D-xyloside xylohydrolase
MKIKLFILVCLAASWCQGRCQDQVVKSVQTVPTGVEVVLTNGILELYPTTDNSVRIKFSKDASVQVPELIFTSTVSKPLFNVVESSLDLQVKTKDIVVVLDKVTGRLSFADSKGNVFLREKVDSRSLLPNSVQGEPCVVAEQGFESPTDECLFGLGQFQDGQFNLRNVTRRLTQVNSQIAIPFYYSSKGYGLLWHQYGLTDFNPADRFVQLEKQVQSDAASGVLAEVTSTSGTQKVSQNQSLYLGKLVVPQTGRYSIFLDLGDMGNRHFVAIDGKPCMDQSNMWLPPTAGALVQLEAGEHQVQVLCKSSNQPTLAWKRCGDETVLRSPNAKQLDYTVFYGPSADKVIATYRTLSGEVPMFPKWAYGYWQCRERYTSGKHLVETIKEFRKRHLPVDVIVQDWQYWGKYGWGVPKFDETNYPNPDQFIQELHQLNAHFSISVWENLDKNSDVAKDYVAKNLYIPNSKWIDIFNPETQKTHWNALNQNLFTYGVDSWWMDATEPENDDLRGKSTFLGRGDFYRLTYPLFVSKAIYEGQRQTSSDKRVCILTRSAFLGQQKYGIINWSGDIGGTWDTFKRQIVAGLNYSITGFPYWTTDIGGFFRPGRSQYTDENYQELLTRWFQWGALNPIFRMHGYQTETEPWKYGSAVEENMRGMLNLRYRLMPYLYSEAWQVTKNGSTLMRPLVMDFVGDTAALNQPYEYLFGKSLLVAPITEAGAREWEVYLPKSVRWFDFWTGAMYEGGQSIKTAAPLGKIPIFVRSGSILPMGKPMEYVQQKLNDTLEIRIYKGADGSFDLYEDEGDNYNYEQGRYTIIPFHWDEQKQQLTIGKRSGTFTGCLKKRVFNIVFVQAPNGAGVEAYGLDRSVSYSGNVLKIKK